MRATPFEQISERLVPRIGERNGELLPRRWEILGDVVIVRLDEQLRLFESDIGEVFADVLRCKSVLVDEGGISGELRTPQTRVIFGKTDTETIHKENGVRFSLDPQKVMFSSGNMDERIRMSTISSSQEVVVDMFAGIGYFSIPMAVKSHPKRVVCCELNPDSVRFLEKNCVLNHVDDCVEVLLGDCRDVAPEGVADRVLMGYVQGTENYLEKAMKVVRPNGGILHFHEVYPSEQIPQVAFSRIKRRISSYGKSVELDGYHVVKSFAPCVDHVVFDMVVR